MRQRALPRQQGTSAHVTRLKWPLTSPMVMVPPRRVEVESKAHRTQKSGMLDTEYGTRGTANHPSPHLDVKVEAGHQDVSVHLGLAEAEDRLVDVPGFGGRDAERPVYGRDHKVLRLGARCPVLRTFGMLAAKVPLHVPNMSSRYSSTCMQLRRSC